VAQLGPRRRYAVARAYHMAGALHELVTDLCAVRGWPRLLGLIPASARPGAVRRVLERRPQGIPPELIRHFPLFGVQYARQTREATDASARSRIFIEGGKRFGQLVTQRGFGKATAVHVFNTAGLEIMLAAREHGLSTVLDQTIVPKLEETRLLSEYHARHPDWEPAPESDSYAAELGQREETEWTLASRIVCGSEFVRQAMLAKGVAAERCEVVPTGIDLAAQGPMREQPPTGRPGLDRPLRVLVVGHVNLRKGVATTAEVARLMGRRAEVRLVGAVQIAPEALARLAQVTQVIGAVPRSDLVAHFHWADVFLLPSIVEGSAVSTYEAMAQGLPLVCTPNAGSIIRDGVEGILVEPDSAEAVVQALERFIADPEMAVAMGLAGRERLAIATLERYSEALRRLAAAR